MLENLSEVLKTHKLTSEEYLSIKDILGRDPNLVEIGIFSAMWSEHCSYKSSKKYLKGFPTEAPWVIQGPGENAGVIDITQGYSAIFKVESHNHPSFIEPYSGAATGVGGIMRDIFTMGARPVASLNAISFARIDEKDRENKPSQMAKKHQNILKGVVGGIGGYGNCIGVPTIGGEIHFDSCYEGNVLCNAFTLGVAKNDEIFYGRAEGIGNPVIYAGSKTGRDGLGGAVMSSDSFDEESKSLRPTVQIGDPFSGKLLLEACLELFKKDLIIGIQDMGAAGLTSSSFEMASRSGSGMKLHLNQVPMRESKMTPYELMLSESQERMLICAKKGKEEEVLKIFKKWEIDVAVIGEVTNTGKMELFWHGEKCADIPIAPITDRSPILSRPTQKPHYLDSLQNQKFIPKITNFKELILQMLGCIEIADKSMIYQQFDSMVQTNTLLSSGQSDASLIRVKENNTALAMSIFAPIDLCYLNPKEGGKIAVATAGRKCVTRGAKPLAISDCLNFGNPENPEVMWQFAEVCEGIKEACSTLLTPVVSGNVSFYNQTEEKDIYPTPTIVSVGLIQDSSSHLTSALKSQNNHLVLIGEIKQDFCGSLIQKVLEKKIYGNISPVDLKVEKRLWDFTLLANEKQLIQSAKSVGKGGLAMALCKMAILGNKGFEITKPLPQESYFSESQSLILFEVQDIHSFQALAKDFDLPYSHIGKVMDKYLDFGFAKINLKEAQEIFYHSFEKIFESK